MSFDLGVWYEPEPIASGTASWKYERLCTGDRTGLIADDRIAAFHAELRKRLPDLDDDVSEGHVLISVDWSQAEDVEPLVRVLAAMHDLVCYDPQSGEVHNG